MNRLVGAKKTGGGKGQPMEKRENKWMSRVLKQGEGPANLGKKREEKWIRRGLKSGRSGLT